MDPTKIDGIFLGDIMAIDYTPFFEEYKKIVDAADQAFEKIESEYSDCVKCHTRCADCCHALFDLTLIEALYINHHFNERFSGNDRDDLLAKANRADRKIYKIKRNAHQATMAGKSEDDILGFLSEERVRCPLLNHGDQCDLYEYRPITCRLYGVPTAIRGKGHTCGLSGFLSGQAYPTANIDNIHRRLYQISLDLIRSVRSKHIKMADLLVPVSMALLTKFDDAYLGIPDPEENREKEGDTNE